jgi:hypothetical protein
VLRTAAPRDERILESSRFCVDTSVVAEHGNGVKSVAVWLLPSERPLSRFAQRKMSPTEFIKLALTFCMMTSILYSG